MHRSQTLEAIIVSRKDWGEADRLLTAFSKNAGKIKIVARGSRRLKSKMACHIEPFSYGKYSVVAGKGYFILTGADSSVICHSFTDNVKKYEDAAYMCELVDMVISEDVANEVLFTKFKESLEALAKDGNSSEILLRGFEFSLLKSIGYEPNYDKCKKCCTTLKEQDSFRGDFEGFFCNNCNQGKITVPKNTLKVLRMLNKGDNILNIKDIEGYNNELKNIVLSYLYDILPRIPRSKKYEQEKQRRVV